MSTEEKIAALLKGAFPGDRRWLVERLRDVEATERAKICLTRTADSTARTRASICSDLALLLEEL